MAAQDDFAELVVADAQSRKSKDGKIVGFSSPAYNFSGTDAWLREQLDLGDGELAVRCYWAGNDLSRAIRQAQEKSRKLGGRYELLLILSSPKYANQVIDKAVAGEYAAGVVLVSSCPSAKPSSREQIKPLAIVGSEGNELAGRLSALLPQAERKALAVPDPLAAPEAPVGDPDAPAPPSQSETASPTHPHNVILYGPPGTGKTWVTKHRALEICGVETATDKEALQEYRRLSQAGRIRFVTFHQSFSYEDFVEGIRPEVAEDTGTIRYEPRDGVFKEICAVAASSSAGNEVFEIQDSTRFWKMSLGNVNIAEETAIYEGCIEDGVLRLGWGEGLDFAGQSAREQVYQYLKDHSTVEKSNDYNVTAMHLFKNEMKRGDIVIVADGVSKFRAIGEIVGDYEFDPDHEWGQKREVKWLRVFDTSLPAEQILKKRLTYKTIYEISRSSLKMDVLSEMLKEAGPKDEPCVLVIDEINRANISKVLGELITLLEPDKRIGGSDEKTVTLPYSREDFGVPPNLYLIGTMNTADRSIAFLDIALRRRFSFVEMLPNTDLVDEIVPEMTGVRTGAVLEALNRRIEFLLDRDHTIGHAYFLSVRSLDDLKHVFCDRVIPLLSEYFYSDWEKIALVLGCPFSEDGETDNTSPILVGRSEAASEVLGQSDVEYDDRFTAELNPGFLEATGQYLAPYFVALVGGDDGP